MKTLSIYPSLLLALSVASLNPLLAQENKPHLADTLRRELTVMTEETLELSTRAPRDLSFHVQAPSVQPTRYTYLDTPIPFALRPSLAPLSALGDLKSGWVRPEQRGYAFIAGGLAFGGKAGAGLKILSTEHDHWDIFGRYQMLSTKAASQFPQENKLKTDSWLLGSTYRHRFDAATLDLRLQGGQTMGNYYGRSLMPPLAGGTASSIELAPELRRRASHFLISGNYQAEEDFSEAWLYQFGAKVDYTQSRYFTVPGDTRQKISEFLPELSADLSHRLSSGVRLGAEGIWSLGSLTAASAIHYGFPQDRTSSTRMLLSASPYLFLDDVSGDLAWRTKGGLRLLLGNDHEKSHLVLFPRIDARLRWGQNFYIGLKTDARLERNTLHSLVDAMPYIAPDAFSGRYDRIYEGKLMIGATVAKRLAIEAFLGYEDHRGATAYRPQVEALPSDALTQAAYLSPLSFIPYYYDYKAQRLGLEAIYRHRGIFSATLRGIFSNYQTNIALKPLPTFTLEGLVELQPLPELTLRAGYDFRSAIDTYDLEANVQRLHSLHRLHADAVYHLSKKLHLTAELRAPLQSSPTHWFGYSEAPLVLFGGLQFVF